MLYRIYSESADTQVQESESNKKWDVNISSSHYTQAGVYLWLSPPWGGQERHPGGELDLLRDVSPESYSNAATPEEAGGRRRRERNCPNLKPIQTGMVSFTQTETETPTLQPDRPLTLSRTTACVVSRWSRPRWSRKLLATRRAESEIRLQLRPTLRAELKRHPADQPKAEGSDFR